MPQMMVKPESFQAWQTPKDLFLFLQSHFVREKFEIDFVKFDIDLFADDKNALCAKYYTQTDNALMQPWHGNVFGNPPYKRSFLKLVLNKALQEIENGNCKQCVLLVKCDTSTKAFQQAMNDFDVYFFAPRIKFELPEGKDNKQRPNFATMLLVGNENTMFRGGFKGFINPVSKTIRLINE